MRTEGVTGHRAEYIAPFSAASGAVTATPKFGNLMGYTIELPGGTSNATGAFVTTGIQVPIGGLGSTFYLDYVLFISTSALAVGGVSFRMHSVAGITPVMSAMGPAGAATAPKFVPVAVGSDITMGPFVTFDASVNVQSVWIRGLVVGNAAAGVHDLQFLNVGAGETITISPTSYCIVTLLA